MIYRLLTGTIALLLFVSGALAQSASDTSFVRPEELEPGFGILWVNYNTGEIGAPKNIIDVAAISPDGYNLAYSEDGILKVKNLASGSITVIDSPCYDAQWSPTGDTLLFTMWGVQGFQFWKVSANRFILDGPADTTLGACYSRWASDGSLYFPTCLPYHGDSTMWRILIDSSLREERFIYQYVSACNRVPSFPPRSMSYHMLGVYDVGQSILNGFDVVSGFVYDQRRTIMVAPPDTSWLYSRTDAWSPRFTANHVVAGPNGDAYIYLSLRAKQERSHHHFPIDSVDSAGRNACGWYHLDTTGHGMVQLVRSWTPDLPLSVTADGSKIYYAFLGSDSLMAIWEMDRLGRNKRQVTFPHEGISGVDRSSNSQTVEIANHVDCLLDGIGEVVVRCHDIDRGELTIDVVDLLGRIVLHVTAEPVRDEIRLPVSELPTGTYLITVRSARHMRSGRFVLP